MTDRPRWMRPEGCARVHFICDAASIAVLNNLRPSDVLVGDTASAHDPADGQFGLWRCVRTLPHPAGLGNRVFECYAAWSPDLSSAAIAEATICVMVCDRNGGFSGEIYDPRKDN